MKRTLLINVKERKRSTLISGHKLSLTLFLLCYALLAFSGSAQTISLSAKRTTAEKLLKDIQKQSGYNVFYDDALIEHIRIADINLKNVSVGQALAAIFNGTGIQFTVKNRDIAIVGKKELLAGHNEHAQQSLSGQVLDAKGNPLAFVSIRNKTTGATTSTDSQGRFQISAAPRQVISLSLVGFKSQEITLSNLQNLTLRMEESIQAIEDIAVTGYTAYDKKLSSSVTTTVQAKDINQVAGLTVDQILQGRVPGMSVISSSGQPGQSAAVVIRGVGSINGSNTPLYVLDGIPIEAGYMQTLNQNDFENVVVLKDASATALYGSRGANGVVLLTSKKGKEGSLRVEYASQYGVTTLSRPNFEMMNTSERLIFEEEAGEKYGKNYGPGWTYSPKNPKYINGTQAFRARADQILDSLRGINIDWRDQFFKNGSFVEQQVSFTGGTDKVRYYNSLNFYNQDGVAIRTGLKRFSLKSNLDFGSDKLTANLNLGLGYSKSQFTEGEGTTSVGTSMASVYYALPYEYPYAPDGTLIHFGNESDYFILDQREGSAGLERLFNSSDKSAQLKTILGGSISYQILPTLKVSTRAGVDYRNSNRVVFINPDSYYGSRKNSNTLGGQGRLSQSNPQNFNLVSTTGITYNEIFNQVHDFEASAFYEYLYNDYRNFGFNAYGIDGRLPETPAGVTNGSVDFMPNILGGKTKSALTSFMGVARYSYDRKYTLTGSYRYDGSTKVAPKNKWHGFYSLGANWNVKEEDFLKSVDAVQTLNFRASYGSTASPYANDFDYLATYGLLSGYGGGSAIAPTEAGNEDFDWEYINEFNVGMDLGLFENRWLRLSVDYYNKITNNMYILQPAPGTSGFEELRLSTGKMGNKGIEWDVNADIIRGERFNWSLGFNGSYNKNEILRVSDFADEFEDGDTRIIKVGHAYGTYYAPRWAGVDTQTGEPQYLDKDGNITKTYNAATQSVPLAAGMYPKWTGGVHTQVSYLGFSASALVSFVADVDRWNNEDFYNENQRYATSNQTKRMLYNRWQNPGDAGDKAILQRLDIPRVFTSKDIQDASFIRLRNVRLNYTFDADALKNIKLIKGIQLFVQGQNLFTWTKWRGLDPENNQVYGRFQYPNSKTFTGGLNVNF
ncbi:SusC/RagA family TonB-linked outer membrane protein [Sphingobacterium humi]|uniref:SusC/RagA family TonB-linked outer membrane protein n=1 Tax=Sphingobacterium humi TaxID=1796905 RepID=A0A6N8KX89_9SPHI|nr:SusC/RagA family TonB-linked outer membrane protein [Sphingobacterium humi]MVZ61434.1 SusC/RagA family TonB-linked outer membrane protein [Sphingobacterium humi]